MKLSPALREAKIGVTTYPTSLQNQGGLLVHIKETARALRGLGLNVEIADPYHESLADYDLIHHFSLNHASFRIVQTAKAFGVPCVVTPMVEPVQGTWRLRRIRWIPKLLHRLFGNEFRHRWQDTLEGLALADAITPITDTERQVIEYLDPSLSDRIVVIPNGVTDLFFSATPAETDNERPELPFVLLPSSIQPYKNQLPVVRAACRLGYKTLLVGPVHDQKYLNECLAEGGDMVTYAGVLDYSSPDLATLFAEAGMVVLASKLECFGLVPFEALAAGTPAALTSSSGLKMAAKPPYFQRVDPDDEQAISDALKTGMSAPRDRAACQALVEEMRWSNVAGRLCGVYESVLT